MISVRTGSMSGFPHELKVAERAHAHAKTVGDQDGGEILLDDRRSRMRPVARELSPFENRGALARSPCQAQRAALGRGHLYRRLLSRVLHQVPSSRLELPADG